MKKNLYFIGIAGSAMGNVAVACARKGFIVSGSDSGIYPPMSTFLEQNGIQMFHSFHSENIQSCNPDMVVIGNAISDKTVKAAEEEDRSNVIDIKRLAGL